MYPCCWRPDRDKYETLLKNHYPWTDDDAAIDREWGATTLYNTFRNPLAHSLGMVDTVKKRGVVVRVPRTGGVGIGKGSLTEKQIETLERSRGRPAFLSATLANTGESVTLHPATLYWGCRRMVETLSANAPLMAETAKFLGGGSV